MRSSILVSLLALALPYLVGCAQKDSVAQPQSGLPQAAYRTAPVTMGELRAAIIASGTIEPVEVFDIGAQVAGQIKSFGKDTKGNGIDYGSPVEEGTVLAQIDDSQYSADLAVAKAQWEVAKAGYDLAKAKGDANAAVNEANLAQARAYISLAQANLDRAQRNKDCCTIKSPIKGIIIDQRVNIGQAVTPSLEAPAMFLIAKDLAHVQVWVSVNEADIAKIVHGMPVIFKVDALPTLSFRGVVRKIRLNASMTQNVVTYTVEVDADNPDGKLLPYLTANVEFEAAHRPRAMLVPNSALRWSPRPEQIAPEFRKVAAANSRSQEQPAPSPATWPSESKHSQPNGNLRPGTLWVQQGEFVRPIKIQAGSTDGSQTEVQGEGLTEGLHVILGE